MMKYPLWSYSYFNRSKRKKGTSEPGSRTNNLAALAKLFLFHVLIMLQRPRSIHAREAAPLARGTFGSVIEE